MGLNRQLANLPDAITTDTSNNVGIGGSPSGSYKLDVTGTGRFTGLITGYRGNFTGADGDYVFFINGGTTAGSSYGLRINAGTNGSDYAIRVKNAAQTSDLFTLLGTGAATFSSSVTATNLILTAGTLFAAGNTGFSNRSSDNTLYLQMPATGFNITDNALNTKFILSSTGAATFSSDLRADGSDFRFGGNFNPTIEAGRTALNINGTSNSMLSFTVAGTLKGYVYHNSTNLNLWNSVNGAVFIATDNTTRMTITSAGNVGIGTTLPSGIVNGSGLVVYDSLYPRVILQNSTTGTSTSAYSGMYMVGNNMYVQNPLANLYFGTLAGSTVMTITSGGDVLIGTTNSNPAENNVKGCSFSQDGRQFISSINNEVMRINRGTTDGVLVYFHQDGVAEGNISVSGTTVSYNGGHLSRYSQTETYQRIEGLLKGTVMSNLDKMAEWINPETGKPYSNEQLNCMKISDIEGDINVAGVFVNWDYDDKEFTNDMNIAMTGDMIIRIAQGVIVEKGQLLMSAGDGTAKPQNDDIIRSKTIAKVTSNYVICTYEDGSYCVPCVLMAC